MGEAEPLRSSDVPHRGYGGGTPCEAGGDVPHFVPVRHEMFPPIMEFMSKDHLNQRIRHIICILLVSRIFEERHAAKRHMTQTDPSISLWFEEEPCIRRVVANCFICQKVMEDGCSSFCNGEVGRRIR